jgi:diguanylate cyclase (GGDEF)-like protein
MLCSEAWLRSGGPCTHRDELRRPASTFVQSPCFLVYASVAPRRSGGVAVPQLPASGQQRPQAMSLAAANRSAPSAWTASLALLRRRATVLATVLLAVLLGMIAVGIVLTQRQSRSHILSNFALRGTTSATFVSTFVSQQADRETDAAQQLLAVPHVSHERFQGVVAAFGSGAAVLLDSAGRVLDTVPADRSLLGKPIAGRYAHLAAAERGQVAISNVVPSAAQHLPVTAIAVPFASTRGRRVFSAAYGVYGSTLEAFVAHTITYRQHKVFLIDSAGRLIAASPRQHATTLSGADPLLARAIARSSLGAVPGARTPSTFTALQVPGTPWRLVIAVPDSKLYVSVDGLTKWIPWIVFALVSVLGVALVTLFARLAALSQRMATSARTDALTALPNRRAIEEHLTRATAHARRHGEPMSLLMIDLDRFKETNDRYGHAAGDRVLRAVADCLREALRAEDLPGRWGGDEFIVVLPIADESQARAVVTRLRAAAPRAKLSDIGLPDGVRMSIGCATATLTSPDEITHAADLDLYKEKSGRAQASAELVGPGSPAA